MSRIFWKILNLNENTYKDGEKQRFMRHMLTGTEPLAFCTTYDEGGNFAQSVTGYYDLERGPEDKPDLKDFRNSIL